VRELSKALIRGAYNEDVFTRLTGRSLSECTSRYEADQTGV
jgi:hypothetical protein